MSSQISLFEIAQHLHELQEKGMENSDGYYQSWYNFYCKVVESSDDDIRKAFKYIEYNEVFENAADIFME